MPFCTSSRGQHTAKLCGSLGIHLNDCHLAVFTGLGSQLLSHQFVLYRGHTVMNDFPSGFPVTPCIAQLRILEAIPRPATIIGWYLSENCFCLSLKQQYLVWSQLQGCRALVEALPRVSQSHTIHHELDVPSLTITQPASDVPYSQSGLSKVRVQETEQQETNPASKAKATGIPYQLAASAGCARAAFSTIQGPQGCNGHDWQISPLVGASAEDAHGEIGTSYFNLG